jgi:serine/threonine protein kinase
VVPVIKDLRANDPATVGPYRLLGRLGTGGMGQVYLAKSPGGRLVAIKLIRTELAEERGFRARFASEIAAARNVSGMYTAAVIDSDTDAEPPWMATAYVPGPSLADAVADDGPLPVKSVLALAAGLAEALGAIHRVGVVHRDLKPSNVLLATDGPRVIDFGISRAIEQSMLTTTGVVLGSPGFMSPEQARGQREVGPPTDVFSLGAVLAYAASGEGPFGAGPTPALLYRVVNERPDLTQVPARLRPLIERCLAKEPADRPTPAEILVLLSPEVGVLTGEWLPRVVSDTFDRYSPTVVAQTPPPPSRPEPAPPAGSGPAEADDPADATQDIAAIQDRTGAVRAGAAAAVIVAAAAITLALLPGGTAKPTSGPTPSLARVTTSPPATRTTASSTHSAAASKSPTRNPTKKPGKKPTKKPSTAQTASPTPTAGSSPSPTVTTHSTPPTSTAPTTTHPVTHPATKTTTSTPSGPQTITGFSGAISKGCSAYGSIGSATGGSSVAYSFVNNSGESIQVWYLTPSGSGQLMSTVSAGNSYSPGVQTGQDWMVANSGGGCIGLFTISGGGAITAG